MVSTHMKHIIYIYIVKMGIFTNFRGEHQKYLKPPPSILHDFLPNILVVHVAFVPAKPPIEMLRSGSTEAVRPTLWDFCHPRTLKSCRTKTPRLQGFFLPSVEAPSQLFLECYLVGGWTNPSEKYANVKMGGNLPQFSGWQISKMFELPQTS